MSRVGSTIAGIALCVGASSGRELAFEYAPIHYHTRAVRNSISQLDVSKLKYEAEYGYLKSVLSALDIDASSQLLVFHSTSLQHRMISPTSPRALYFNDSTYVGWIPDADLLEIISIDPVLGPIFYDIPQTPVGPVNIRRNNEACLTCHSSSKTQSVPGLLVRSARFAGDGRVPGEVVTHETNLADRWGGWYVTGETGGLRHRGNQPTVPEADDAHLNRNDLSAYFDASRYLSPSSDVLALMVLEHQCHMFNVLNRANYRVRIALHDHGVDPDDAYADLPDAARRELFRNVSAVVSGLLFADEAEIKEPITGDTDFAAEFLARGPFDEAGRSLREIEGEGRLFRYPCSYMIYSDHFHHMPAILKRAIYRGLRDVLVDPEPTSGYEHLSSEDKREVYALLKATIAEF